MDIHTLCNDAREYVLSASSNRISAELAITPDLAGIRIFDMPVLAVADACDPLFETLRQPDIIGSHFAPPAEWLCGAKSVLSYFLPFTPAVRDSNRKNMSWPSDAWLHGRIEGQAFIEELSLYLAGRITAAGYAAVVPYADSRFFVSPKEGLDTPEGRHFFTTNWSERHVGYVCGIGTFGLSKGIITEKGMAGRMGSLITTLALEPTRRTYSGYMDYCTRCGLCALNCPADAISLETGKDHFKCRAFLDKVLEKHEPRYGCGKCQIDVPCETCIP